MGVGMLNDGQNCKGSDRASHWGGTWPANTCKEYDGTRNDGTRRYLYCHRDSVGSSGTCEKCPKYWRTHHLQQRECRVGVTANCNSHQSYGYCSTDKPNSSDCLAGCEINPCKGPEGDGPFYVCPTGKIAKRAEFDAVSHAHVTSINAAANTIQLAEADSTIVAGEKIRLANADADGPVSCAARPKGSDLVVASVIGDVITLSTNLTAGDSLASTNCVVEIPVGPICTGTAARGSHSYTRCTASDCCVSLGDVPGIRSPVGEILQDGDSGPPVASADVDCNPGYHKKDITYMSENQILKCLGKKTGQFTGCPNQAGNGQRPSGVSARAWNTYPSVQIGSTNNSWSSGNNQHGHLPDHVTPSACWSQREHQRVNWLGEELSLIHI